MRTLPIARTLAALSLALAVAACGGPPTGALLGPGKVQHCEAGGTWTDVAAGPVPFTGGDALKVEGGPVRMVIACEEPLSSSATLEGDPERGDAVVVLAAGSQLRRRAGSTLELVSGSAEVRTGPLSARLVIFHGESFVEAHAGHTENGAGVILRATGDGESLTIELEKGAVQLLTPVTKPMDLHLVKLAAGESATATPGASPKKADSGD